MFEGASPYTKESEQKPAEYDIMSVEEFARSSFEKPYIYENELNVIIKI